jgi:hypothetical protein
MLVLFVVHLAPGADASTLLTEQTLIDTQAQVMTADEARKAGFDGLPQELPPNVRLIAAHDRDRRRIVNGLEASPAASSFSVHEVG